MSWTRIKIFYYDVANYLRNIWVYRRLYREDWPWQADGIMCFLEIKLENLIKTWESGIGLSYEGEEKDLEDMVITYNALINLKELDDMPTEDLFKDIDFYLEKKKEYTNTIFETLKKYENWWI